MADKCLASDDEVFVRRIRGEQAQIEVGVGICRASGIGAVEGRSFRRKSFCVAFTLISIRQ